MSFGMHATQPSATPARITSHLLAAITLSFSISFFSYGRTKNACAQRENISLS